MSEGGAVAVDHEHDVGAAPGGADDEVERLREADVAGVQHDRFVTDAELGPVRRDPRAGGDRRRVDEVGDHVHPVGLGGSELGGDVAPQVVAQHGHGRRRAVADPLEPAGGGDQATVGDGARAHGSVGEDVLDVEHQRGAPYQPDQTSRQPQREWRRHRHDGVGTAAPTSGAEASKPDQHREGGETDGSAHQVRLVVAGKRVHTRDRAP
jgi:hypothetical protein